MSTFKINLYKTTGQLSWLKLSFVYISNIFILFFFILISYIIDIFPGYKVSGINHELVCLQKIYLCYSIYKPALSSLTLLANNCELYYRLSFNSQTSTRSKTISFRILANKEHELDTWRIKYFLKDVPAATPN